MNILVTGANGQLGREMRNLSALDGGDRFIFTDVVEAPGLETVILDITSPEAVQAIVRERKVDVIVNCAAYTNVDKAEDDFAAAELLNAKAPGILAGAAAEAGATLIHISTDYVFNGLSCVPYSEEDAPDPNGAYGVTKLAGEKEVQASGCNYIIIRTAWLYSPYGKNFVKTMRSLTGTKDSLKVVFDQVGSPTCAADLAALIFHILGNGEYLRSGGIYHFTDEGVISWYDFAQEICALSGNSCDIQPCHSSEFPSKVRRPHYSVLDKSRVRETFGFRVPWWKDSLKECISRLEEIENQSNDNR